MLWFKTLWKREIDSTDYLNILRWIGNCKICLKQLMVSHILEFMLLKIPYLQTSTWKWLPSNVSWAQEIKDNLIYINSKKKIGLLKKIANEIKENKIFN